MTKLYRFRPRRRRKRFPRTGFWVVGIALAGFISLAPRESPPGSGTTWQSEPGTTSPSASGATLIDRVTRVRDGDTIVVGLIPLRIANLDCAEGGTAKGARATRRAKELVAGQTLTCRLHGRRSYDREIATCVLNDGADFGEVLIAEGYCARWR